MTRRVHAFVRELHLYLGLFVSPFVIVFALSAVFLVHAWVPASSAPPERRTATDVPIPPDFEKLKGREQLAAARAVLDRLGIHGEIGFIRQFPRDRRVLLPVTLPGRETTVELSLATRSAVISSHPTGLGDATVFLHKMPGPHNVSLRGNSGFMRVWRWLADASVYLVLFLSLSGLYLWAALKAERRAGLALLAAGAVSIGGLVYALVA